MKDSYRLNKKNFSALQFVKPLDVRSTIKGLSIMVSNLSALPELLSDCIETGSDFENLFTWITKFAHPVHLVKSIGTNVSLNLGQVAKMT